MVDVDEVRELLTDQPDLEPALQAVLDQQEPWEFDEVDVDSGEFGELVSRGVVENADDGYRVSDETAVRRALGTEPTERDATSRDWLRVAIDSLPGRDVRRRQVGILVVVLGLVAVFRLLSYPAVFRGSDIVLTGNDPYYYRYWVEQFASSPAVELSSLPQSVARGEPLLIVGIWMVSELLGGSVEAVGIVLSWYPVVVALFTGLCVFGLAELVTDDRRISVGAVALLAVTPVHAFRSSVGFADHHAFDYLWLVLTALAVTVAIRNGTDGSFSWQSAVLGVVGVAVGVTGQVLSWEAAPLMLLPMALVFVVDGLRAAFEDRSAIRSTGPVAAGVGLAAVFVWVVHSALNWHTTVVAVSPGLLFVGAFGVLLGSEGGRRFGVRSAVVFVVYVAGGIGGVYTLASLFPGFQQRVQKALFRELLRGGGIAETSGLLGDSFGWLLLFGFILLLALPYIALGATYIRTRPRWIPVVVYATVFLVLSVAQVRFAGQLALFTAVFGAIGFVHLAERVDVARRPVVLSESRVPIDDVSIPERQTARTVVILFLLVTSLGMVQTGVKTSQLTIDDAEYRTAKWTQEYRESQGWAENESGVISDWGRNRMFNYFVNGDSREDSFAQNNYAKFVLSTNEKSWYKELSFKDIRFVVLTPAAVTNQSALGTRLYRANTSRSGGSVGTKHFRLLYQPPGGSFKVFSVIPGALVVADSQPNTTVSVTTTVSNEAGTFDYHRTVTADPNGRLDVVLPYPGRYQVGNETVELTEQQVQNGTIVVLNESVGPSGSD
jgi:dolichyl-diphosphooligosaccharide--protein glycosyltransferase